LSGSFAFGVAAWRFAFLEDLWKKRVDNDSTQKIPVLKQYTIHQISDRIHAPAPLAMASTRL
jgi:hypothetical protein